MSDMSEFGGLVFWSLAVLIVCAAVGAGVLTHLFLT